MRSEKNNSDSTQEDGMAITRRTTYRKFTLTVDCDGLLKPKVHQSDICTSKSADEAVSFFQLDTVMAIPDLDQLKVRCFHTCELLQIEGHACLEALWSIGDWFETKYQPLGKSVRCEHLTEKHMIDWTEPDATLVVFISDSYESNEDENDRYNI